MDTLRTAGDPRFGLPDVVHEALDRFAIESPAKAELVKLRFFAGLTLDEAAEILGLPERTAQRHWAYAKVWLFDAIRGGS